MSSDAIKEPGPAVRIKKFCSTPESPVKIPEMREFMEACKQDDAKAGVAVGTTLAKLAEGIPID